MLEKSIKTLNTGDKVVGVVVNVTPTEIQVDLGTKHAGYIPVSEYSDDPTVKVEDCVKVGDTIEAMHDGVQPRDERGRELAARFERLGGMPSALTGLKRLANQRTQGPKKYGRDFYAGIQRRTLSFLKDALEALHEQA